MEHYIALNVDPKDYTKDLPKKWYRLAKESLPSGATCSATMNEKQVLLHLVRKDDKVSMMIPLVRNLTETETKRVVEALDDFGIDYTLSTSRVDVGVHDTVEIKMEHKPVLDLCTKWAKDKHDTWMKTKIEDGWRYGPTVSVKNKTHPLLRQWSDLPAEYRKVDTSQVEELLKLFNESGYVMVARDELASLMDSKLH